MRDFAGAHAAPVAITRFGSSRSVTFAGYQLHFRLHIQTVVQAHAVTVLQQGLHPSHALNQHCWAAALPLHYSCPLAGLQEILLDLAILLGIPPGQHSR